MQKKLKVIGKIRVWKDTLAFVRRLQLGRVGDSASGFGASLGSSDGTTRVLIARENHLLCDAIVTCIPIVHFVQHVASARGIHSVQPELNRSMPTEVSTNFSKTVSNRAEIRFDLQMFISLYDKNKNKNEKHEPKYLK